MAIIYTYPTQTTANGSDLLLLTNSADEGNPTYNIKVSKLAGQMSAYANNISWEQTLLVESATDTGARLNKGAYLILGTDGDAGNVIHVPTDGVNPAFMAAYADYYTAVLGVYTIETQTCKIQIDDSSPGGELQLFGLKSFSDNVSARGELSVDALWIADGSGSIEKGTLMVAY